MPHHPAHIRDAFTAWVDQGQPDIATIKVDYRPREVPASRLLGRI